MIEDPPFESDDLEPPDDDLPEFDDMDPDNDFGADDLPPESEIGKYSFLYDC